MLRKDYTGQVINGKKVISFLKSRLVNGASLWNWQCIKCGACGFSEIGIIKRCKCRHCSYGGEGLLSDKYLGCGNLNQSFFIKIKRNASVRGLVWDIDAEFLWDLFCKQESKCALSGREIVLDKGWCPHKVVINTASVDRKNSLIGYTKENVWWIHKDFQSMKMAAPLDVFISRCKEIVRYNETTSEVEYPYGY